MNSNDRTTPADTPEQISPFNPPSFSNENSETDQPADSQSSANRPSFARANSEWLRRIQKTPPGSSPANEPPSPPSRLSPGSAIPAQEPAADSPQPIEPAAPSSMPANESPVTADWARALDAERAARAPTDPPITVDKQAAESPAPTPPSAASDETPPPAKPVLGEIKLTGDDYDYSDIGGQVTDEMKAQLEASATNLSSTEDEVELARRLLGLDVETSQPTASAPPAEFETPFADVPVEPPASPPPTAAVEAPKPVLAEIKLTGDDYDYSDIGGEVTEEMKAQLEAGATEISSTEDEVALARRLLGLDIETPQPTASAPASSILAGSMPADEPLAPPLAETPPIYAAASEPEVMQESAPVTSSSAANQSLAEIESIASAPVISSAATNEPIAEIETASPIPAISEPVAELETPAVTAPSSADVIQPTNYPATEPPPPAKPVLSEIKLTTDDYDYSDIGGQVTDEMKAQLQANAAALSSTDDQVELARRLLGLDIETPAQPAAPVTTAPIAQAPVPSPIEGAQPLTAETLTPDAAEELAEVLQSEQDLEAGTPDWLAALAASSSVAVAHEQTISEIEDVESEVVMPREAAPSEPAPTLAEPVTTVPIAGETPEPIAAAPVAEQPVAEQPVAEPPVETPPAKPSLQGGQLPEWLREIAPPDVVARDLAAEPAPDVSAISAADEGALPAWVQALAPDAERATASTMFKPLPDLDETERDELPDWLREPPAPVTPPAPAEPISTQAIVPVPRSDEQEGEGEGDEPAPLVPAGMPGLIPALELPSWFTDSAPGANALRDPFEPIETTGPLAGVSGILPLALAITEPHVLTTTTPTRSDGGRIFQTILAEPLTAASRPAAQQRSTLFLKPQHLVYALILLAALIPLFFSLDQSGLGLDASKSASAAYYDQLQSVPADGAALLVFDYSPGQAVELDPAARVTVNTLAARGVNVIALSTTQSGPTIAENILERARVTEPKFNFVNVGYLAGGQAAVRNLSAGWLKSTQPLADKTTWGASPLSRTVQSMNDLGLVILFAPDDNALQLWMEQARPYTTSPIVAATSAQTTTRAATYLQSKQLRAQLNGLKGAAELELLTNTAGQAVKTVDALSLVSLVLAGIIIAANVIMLLKRGNKTK